jgi:hypothetical protein
MTMIFISTMTGLLFLRQPIYWNEVIVAATDALIALMITRMFQSRRELCCWKKERKKLTMGNELLL